jgi:3-phosphoshikimate 1-carboxyvinyltransferase
MDSILKYIEVAQKDMTEFAIEGGQAYTAFSEHIKADFSSATFFLCAAAITGPSASPLAKGD